MPFVFTEQGVYQLTTVLKTFISSLIDAGININTIRSYVGHADERTTYGSYCFDRTPDTEKKMLLERALVS